MELYKDTTLQVGALGQYVFPAGWYAYTGSAKHGMAARVARHMRRQKRIRWHIDYLTCETGIVAAFCDPNEEANECAWARRLVDLPGASTFLLRFGSSDCRCQGHLIHFSVMPNIKDCIQKIDEALA
jgi:Uri superfamily endonuclease